jgi:IS5 family transposase
VTSEDARPLWPKQAGWIAETAALDSSYVKAHRAVHGGQGGRRRKPLDPRGGQTTKVHIPTDVLGRPAVVHLTPGNILHVKTAPEVIAAAPGRLKRLLADRGYDAKHLRRDLKAARTTPIIPGRVTRKRPVQYDRHRHRERWRIEARSVG